MNTFRRSLWLLAGVLLLGGAAPVHAGFTGTDVFLPSVGAKPGVPPAVWYTTVWVHNPNPTPANVTFYLLERKENLAPRTYTDTIPAGDTKRWDNEEDKPPGERGRYLHPEAWGQAVEMGEEWRAPKKMRNLRAAVRAPQTRREP